jgi:glycosyltransferase involved in cell wall biosynthesis
VKLVAIGFNVAGTGLTRVMSSVLGRLADRHEIHFLGIGHSGEVVRDRGLTVLPTNPHGGDVFAAFQARELIEEIGPDVVLVMHDLWMFEYYLRLLGPYRDRVKIVACIPLDGRIADAQDAAPLVQADRVVAYTSFARAEFEGAFARLRERSGGAGFPAVEVIPHGVDLDRFGPLPGGVDRAAARRRVFGEGEGGGESFVVLNASRPDRRKRVDLTIRGFAMFAAGKPANVKLCLHHPVMGEAAERELAPVIRECGLGSRLVVNPLGREVVGDEELNLLYNACDVGLNTAMGEGWGLVSFEHGATGAAQIVPDHTACGELWRGCAELVPPARRFVPQFTRLEMAEVSPEGVAGALEALYRNPRRRERLGRAAVSVARNPAYSWDAVARRFDELFVGLAGAVGPSVGA